MISFNNSCLVSGTHGGINPALFAFSAININTRLPAKALKYDGKGSVPDIARPITSTRLTQSLLLSFSAFCIFCTLYHIPSVITGDGKSDG